MTISDIVSTLELNKMLTEKEGQYEIVMDSNNSVNIKNKRLYAKGERLTWVPYMVATKGDAGILNIPREQSQSIATSDISLDAIIPAQSRQTPQLKSRLTRSSRKNQREGS